MRDPGSRLPEADAFGWFGLDQLAERCAKSMAVLLVTKGLAARALPRSVPPQPLHSGFADADIASAVLVAISGYLGALPVRLLDRVVRPGHCQGRYQELMMNEKQPARDDYADLARRLGFDGSAATDRGAGEGAACRPERRDAAREAASAVGAAGDGGGRDPDDAIGNLSRSALAAMGGDLPAPARAPEGAEAAGLFVGRLHGLMDRRAWRRRPPRRPMNWSGSIGRGSGSGRCRSRG